MKKQNQTMLTAFFLAVMLAGFGAVAYISEMDDLNVNSIELFKTDSNTDFGSYTNANYPNPNWWDYTQSCQRGRDSSIVPPIQYNRTVVYTGNNTWTMQINSTSFNIDNFGLILVELPNLENWLIDYIHFNSTRNTDSDVEISASINFPDNAGIYDYDLLPLYSVIFQDINADSITGDDYNNNVSISNTKSHEIYQMANQKDKNAMMVLHYEDINIDGISAFAWEISFTIYGTQINGWSIIDSITAVLIISATVNIIIAVYMTDGIDIGGYVKDLRKNKRRS